jgi:hypothetical protein
MLNFTPSFQTKRYDRNLVEAGKQRSEGKTLESGEGERESDSIEELWRDGYKSTYRWLRPTQLSGVDASDFTWPANEPR